MGEEPLRGRNSTAKLDADSVRYPAEQWISSLVAAKTRHHLTG